MALLSDLSPQVLGKSDYARRIGVDPSRITQLIKDGRLRPALRGEGRSAKIAVEEADRILGRSLDMVQATVNGRARIEAPAEEAEEAPASGKAVSHKSQYELERLRTLQYDNARKFREEEAAKGRYLLSEQARRAQAKELGDLVAAFESFLLEHAASEARQAEQDDAAAVTRARQAFRAWRERLSAQASAEAEALPALVEDPDWQDPEEDEADDAGGDDDAA
ncbi:MAG: hypothetical protein WD341_06130 [Tistlia sp.]|uniref:hypothetical protein n=1 Tax=Tistlia sp. TaxID=3057121 RepID=UPI0034A18DFF